MNFIFWIMADCREKETTAIEAVVSFHFNPSTCLEGQCLQLVIYFNIGILIPCRLAAAMAIS